MLSHSTVREGLGPSSRCRRTNCFSARTAVLSSIFSSCRSHQPPGAAAASASHHLLPAPPHLAHHRLLVAQDDDEDAVGLADAADGPRRQGEVSLVEDDAVDVLLLRQPARQAVLLDAAEAEGSAGGAAQGCRGRSSRGELPVQRRGAETRPDDVAGEEQRGAWGRWGHGQHRGVVTTVV